MVLIMKTAQKLLVFWLIIMFLVAFTSSLVYLVAQQTVRLGANEQPMQLAMDTEINLEKGQSAVQAIPANNVDISKSLSPFVMVFDINKNLLTTSGMIGSSKPTYPKGILDSIDKNGEDRVTWQPQQGLRYATVAIKFTGGYIVAGRSLSETEKLIDEIGKVVLLAWFACTIFSVFALIVIYIFIIKVFKTRQKIS
ncbi:conserved exported hypothetical protein [Candidatus Desulfosporosinus infrequens]|uniref:Uncharacterized protein n=1 Tax=Candidatus Desulfosporosinus infrequens TaxID=2043169 RepID=A0A2U3KE41_9FIRM|nr:conserved exported hypothetical protein [Candidatus Desulfosporosinus infrequens]